MTELAFQDGPITVRRPGGAVSRVQAMVCQQDRRFAIHRRDPLADTWAVTHVPSGVALMVTTAGDGEQKARRALQQLITITHVAWDCTSPNEPEFQSIMQALRALEPALGGDVTL
jgi:hypothetical protein